MSGYIPRSILESTRIRGIIRSEAWVIDVRVKYWRFNTPVNAERTRQLPLKIPKMESPSRIIGGIKPKPDPGNMTITNPRSEEAIHNPQFSTLVDKVESPLWHYDMVGDNVGTSGDFGDKE
jgi:hypothetical protein